jgi:hypothetical protein
MMNQLTNCARRFVFLATLITAASAVAAATAQVGGPTDIPVRGVVQFHNDTGHDARDLEFQICNKEAQPNGGASASTGAFGGGIANFARDGCVNFVFDVGVVNKGQAIDVDITFWLFAHNSLIVKRPTWTNLVHDPLGPAGPPGGWAIGDPRLGGDGGDGGLGGGGKGGQGGGGGFGNYLHDVELINDSDKDWLLNELKLLASMTTYDDLKLDVPWAQIDPIDFGGATVIVPAHSSFTYAFETTGSYRGGHVYLNFNFDDPVRMIGDHPVVIPEPQTLALVLTALWAMRRRPPAVGG